MVGGRSQQPGRGGIKTNLTGNRQPTTTKEVVEHDE
jgi:hypothetical protein